MVFCLVLITLGDPVQHSRCATPLKPNSVSIIAIQLCLIPLEFATVKNAPARPAPLVSDPYKDAELKVVASGNLNQIANCVTRPNSLRIGRSPRHDFTDFLVSDLRPTGFMGQSSGRMKPSVKVAGIEFAIHGAGNELP